MEEIMEEFISGFCRTFNQGQTVTCEFVNRGDGIELLEADCAYDKCIHKGSCEVARQIREIVKGDADEK
jgi:hypothetical protein